MIRRSPKLCDNGLTNLARPVLQMLGVKHIGHCATAQHTGASGIYVTWHMYRQVFVLGIYHVKDVWQSLQ